MSNTKAKNVLGTPLLSCSLAPMTGFYRDGYCETGPEDRGTHTVCAKMTEEFLLFSKSRGNDLMTPRPEWQFPGLKAGDFWCLCASRWKEAYLAGIAPKLKLQATHEKTLAFVDLDVLIAHSL